MEGEIQTWGYWVIGGLQIIVIATALRVGRLINTCSDAYEWASSTRSLHFDIPTFKYQVGKTYDAAIDIPLQVVFTFVINCLMLYLISINSVFFVATLIAAAVNATTVLNFVTSSRAIDNILTFIAEVIVAECESITETEKDNNEQ